ncbi:MAG: hypothetical protein ACLSUW_08340 [Akkermansia sp.]
MAALTAAIPARNAAMKLYVDAMKDRFHEPHQHDVHMLNQGGGEAG